LQVNMKCDEIVSVLIKAGANVNAVTNKGETAAHFGARQGALKALKVLAKFGADFSIASDEGQTCLDWARIHRQNEVAQYLTSEDLTHSRRTPSKRNNDTSSDSDDELAGVFAKKCDKEFTSLGKVPTRMPKKITVGADSGVGRVDCSSPDLLSEQLQVSTNKNRLTFGPESPGSPELWSEVEQTKATFNALDTYAQFNTIVREQFSGEMTKEDELLLFEMMEMGFDDAEANEDEISAIQQSSDSNTDDDSHSTNSGHETMTNSDAGSNITAQLAQMDQLENDLLKQQNEHLKRTLQEYQELFEELAANQ